MTFCKPVTPFSPKNFLSFFSYVESVFDSRIFKLKVIITFDKLKKPSPFFEKVYGNKRSVHAYQT